jgi:hypothetical protein
MPHDGAVPRSDTAKALSILRLSQNYPGWRETRRQLRPLPHRAQDMVRSNFYPIHCLAEALRARYKLAGEQASTSSPPPEPNSPKNSTESFQEPIPSR